MSEIMPFIWIGIIVFAAIAEIYTYALITVWFIPSAVTAFILSLTGFHVRVQVFVFFIIALVSLVISKTIFRNFMKSKLITGRNAIVTEEINNYKNTGLIRTNGTEYHAKSDDDDIIYETGLVVTIIRTEGEYAICSR